MENNLCDGCRVNNPHEHRCHGQGCNCYNLICMEKQGKITQEQQQEMVSKWMEVKGGKKWEFPSIIEPDTTGESYRVVGQDGPPPVPLYWGTKDECKKWQEENCVVFG